MTTAVERDAETDEQEEESRTAFGLALSIDRRISIPGLGQSGSPLAGPPSRVSLDEGELDRRWGALTKPAQRAREIRFGEKLLLSVDFAEPAGYLLWALNYGRVLISPDGVELLCEPDPANPNWASIVASQALPLAATVRGLEVMHASGVVIDGSAVLIAGPPGAGKSSLAAALLRSGRRLLSDDAVALRLTKGLLVAHPGSVVLQLRPAEDRRLSTDERAALGRMTSQSEGKHRYVGAEVPDAAPLGSLFLLERSTEQPAVERLAAVDPFELIGSTFNLSVRTPDRLQRQLDVVSAIASLGLAHRLRVQPNVGADQLAATIEQHLREI
jgi:hypothetical protein